MRINLTAESDYEKAILEYLEKNASDVLVEKINNGTKVTVKETDGERVVINKKTMKGFFGYAEGEAKKLKKSGNCVAVRDNVVYGWAVHYFEEDSIHGELFNEDGTPYPPRKCPTTAKPKQATAEQKPVEKAKEAVKEPKLSRSEKMRREAGQFDLFDFIGGANGNI